ncbi:MAG: hypothetical protein AAGA92_10920 [Planctomycetota bacterium]
MIGWDGLLPCAVAGLSWLAAAVLGNAMGLGLLVVIGLPIAAFFARFYVGKQQIDANYCPRGFRTAQLLALGFTTTAFIFVDLFIVLSAFGPAQGAGAPPRVDEHNFPYAAAAVCVYFTLVAFAMYPGREKTELVQHTAAPA